MGAERAGSPMELRGYLARLFEYDAWANRETLASLRAAGVPSPRALRLAAHVVAAEWLWLCRLERKPPHLAVWPELALDECEAQAAGLPRRWKDLLEALPLEALARHVSYVNSKGEPWTSSLQDIVTHVVLHSAYHRGQIAADQRGSGQAPAYTDFIHCTRQGFLD